MRCTYCHTENPETARFCIECGAALKQSCAKCQLDNLSHAKYCAGCGSSLTDSSASHAKPASVLNVSVDDSGLMRGSRDGERRHLTVLFCDLVGSTAIAARIDPEEWRETVANYHRAAAEAILRFGGYVAKYLGDGVMAFFGWPEAHDNDAERAVRGGLAILDSISKLSEKSGSVNLSARIGIDSGPVVVGVGAGKDVDVFGDAPNIAARVQSVAASGSVAITEATHRLVSGLFIVQEQGSPALSGIARPIPIFQVVRPSGMRGRLAAAAAVHGITSFVGREDELRLLINRWERVRDGEGQVVTILGEAGIGKSRLIQRFREEIAGTPFTWIECETSPFFQNTPFYAVADMLRQSFQWDDNYDQEQRLRALRASVALAELDPNEAVPLIAPLLELPVDDRYPPLSLAPDQQRKRLMATLVGWTLAAAKVQPLVIATEDLHWADASTLELTQLLVEQGAGSRLLLLYSARPEFRAAWPLRAHHTQITLNRLNTRDIRRMVAQVAASKALSDETIATVIDRTAGVPLFVEEITRAVLERGETKQAQREIPATLHDSLLARLDRLGSAKEVIQVGAVLGGDFSYQLLHAICAIAEEDLQNALRVLVDADLLNVRGIPPQANYHFRHALIRDAAYEALLKSRRKELHHSAARSIVEKFPALREVQPEIVAHHWTEAGENEPAIGEWKKAADRALLRSANAEAVHYFANAINLLTQRPDTPQASDELTLQVTMAVPLMASKGYGALEVEAVFARAADLCETLGNSARQFPVIGGLHRFNLVRGRHDAANELAKRCASIAQTIGDPDLTLESHLALGESSFYMGNMVSAQNHLMQATLLCSSKEHRSPTTRNLQDPEVAALTHLAIATEILGHPDKAAKLSQQVISLAQEIAHPFSLAYALTGAAMLHQINREFDASREHVEAALLASREGGFALLEAEATFLLGYAQFQCGQQKEGLLQMRKGLAEWRATGAEIFCPYYLGCLASSCSAATLASDASDMIAEAITLARKSNEQMCGPELLRLDGEIRSHSGTWNNSTSERCFREAKKLAAKEETKLWELRSATSLAKSLRNSDRIDEAHVMLAEIYSWFTEGFGTPDLKDAKALLDELES